MELSSKDGIVGIELIFLKKSFSVSDLKEVGDKISINPKKSLETGGLKNFSTWMSRRGFPIANN